MISNLGPFTIIVAKQSLRQDNIFAFLPLVMPYASISVNVLQSEQEEEDALVKNEDANKHEIVQEIFFKSCIRETLNL